ncbi:NmrA-like family domain-containing protein 1 [Phialemonium atrogriseum]|uniref:NmrA-like family domain-containing protein 1 n=1 Tax=Phialemonium atrogriseum TaxID=1093897 RepID=A0AAJ0FFE6_9PEZI|nr:NmrA-like family domain-containing protein 1 [Phialemonium atrogriseum]KAK1765372.1 NmrA-like family domain-containing protein 1 [Phialemonium atrogriseum]
MSAPTPSVLVVGATGKQGGAVVTALLNLPEPRPKILALTRNAESAGAKALAEAHPGAIELVQGDSTDPAPIFETRPKGSISGIFVVTSPGKVDEEKQAIPLIDAAVSHGVKHVVFSSVDRGGDARSWDNPTDVKHFYQKHNIEVHVRDKAAREPGSFTWTVLRPVAFLDNMNPGMFCSMFTAMWASALSPATKLQLVSVRDIGVFAARALASPEEWAGRAVGLAGDALTLAEAKERFAKVTGKELPQSWTFLGKAVLWTVGDLGAMFAFFEKEGYGVDIAALRKEESSLQDFETWLKQSSKWKE